MRAWNSAGGSPCRVQQPAHRQLQHAVGGLAVEHPVGQCGAERRDAVAAPAGMHVDRPLAGRRAGQRLQQDVADGGVYRRRVDGAEVAEEPQDVRGADPDRTTGSRSRRSRGRWTTTPSRSPPAAYRRITSTGSSSGRGTPQRWAALRCDAIAPGPAASTAAAMLCSWSPACPGAGRRRDGAGRAAHRRSPGTRPSATPSAASRSGASSVISPWWADAHSGNGVHVHARPVGRHPGEAEPVLGPVVFRFRDADRPGTDPAQMRGGVPPRRR